MLIQTVPFKDIEEANLYRGCSKNLRACGYKAHYYRVEYAVYLAKNRVKQRGSSRDFTTRHFLRGLIQGIRPFPDMTELSYSDVANSLEHCGVTVNKVKDAKRYPFIFNVIDNTSANRKLIRFLLNAFGLGALYGEILQILVFKGLSNGHEIIQAP
jgi:cell fate regulator YaaT (PSP1 superfamily)